MTEWPLEARIFLICASVAAISIVVGHGIIVAAISGAVYLLIVGLTGWPPIP